MGDVLRRYWMPALLVGDLPAPDCPPVRVKLLGEDLVAFRDTNGRVGLLDEYCPHRLTSMFLGRNEECGLRCVYHGWKFDVDGNCVDMPNEPADSRFKDKIKLLSYPVVELGGVIWAYMGPADKRPDPPGMEWLRAPENQRFVSKTHEYCNYVQAIEGGIDTVHSSFLHNNNLDNTRSLKRDTAPRLEVERTGYGFRYAGIRQAGEQDYVRMYQFVMPFQQFRSQRVNFDAGGGEADVPLLKGHMWVPMDDHNTMVFNWMFACDETRPLTPEYIRRTERHAGRDPEEGETVMRRRVRANDWLIDRELQRRKTFTGITGLNTQDLAVQEAMGPVVPRWREHLGSTDRAITTMRRILLDAIETVAGGGDPPGVDPRSYRDIRAADALLPKGVPWQEAGRDLLLAVH
jgi:phenylpropionate dioxygenase-like ring-hydroxylating dioxygenase large terminal subunit